MNNLIPINIFSILGILVVLIIGIYFYLKRLFKKHKSKLNIPILDTKDMPWLKPIPIPTKNQSKLWKKLLVLIFMSRTWELQKDWFFKLETETNNQTIIIPRKFVFDGASIPRPLWFLLSPVGVLFIPALIHDHGYQHRMVWTVDSTGKAVPMMEGAERKDWDKLFKRVARQVNGFILLDWLAYLAIRAFGKSFWNEHEESQRSRPEEPVFSYADLKRTLQSG